MVANLYRRLNILSIDVALGAMCGALFFAKLLQVQVLVYGVVCLGLTVWIIYTVDHLLDAKRIGQRASTRRHRFHHYHFNILLRWVMFAILVNGAFTFFMRERVLIGGIFLLIGVVLYLLVNRYLKILKELLISILYTCGVLMPSVMVTNLSVVEIPWIVVVQFILVAFVNLLVFSWFDHENDLQDKTRSFVTTVGKNRTLYFIGMLFLLISFLFGYAPTKETFLIFCIGLGHSILVFGHQYFRVNERFRILGDALFIIPAFLYFL